MICEDKSLFFKLFTDFVQIYSGMFLVGRGKRNKCFYFENNVGVSNWYIVSAGDSLFYV